MVVFKQRLLELSVPVPLRRLSAPQLVFKPPKRARPLGVKHHGVWTRSEAKLGSSSLALAFLRSTIKRDVKVYSRVYKLFCTTLWTTHIDNTTAILISSIKSHGDEPFVPLQSTRERNLRMLHWTNAAHIPGFTISWLIKVTEQVCGCVAQNWSHGRAIFTKYLNLYIILKLREPKMRRKCF